MSEAFDKGIEKFSRRTKSNISGIKQPVDMEAEKPLSNSKFPHHSAYGTNKSSTKHQSSIGLNSDSQNHAYHVQAKNLDFLFGNIDDNGTNHQRNGSYLRIPYLVSRDRFLQRKHVLIQEKKRKLDYPELYHSRLYMLKNPFSNFSFLRKKNQNINPEK